jgi:DNA-directed RNA polymerase specialized sigma24 family protein
MSTARNLASIDTNSQKYLSRTCRWPASPEQKGMGGPTGTIERKASRLLMARKPAGPIPEERAATPDEVRAAIDALSKTDWYRLRKFADYHVFLLGEKSGDRRGPDLLNEAFLRLLQGSRKWDKSKVGFMGFLYGAIESIADSWLRKKGSPTEAPVLASSLIKENEDGDLSDPAEEFQSETPDQARMLIYRETLDDIATLLADDQEIQMIIEGIREGLDPPAIRELWGLSQPQYNAIVVRMRRRIARANITDPTMERRHVQ